MMMMKILRLSPYHCELNPIELVWSEVKRYVAGHNTNFKKNEVRNLISEAYLRATQEKWNNYVNDVIATERTMWEVDNLLEDIEPIIININDADSDINSKVNNSDSE